mgnify:CR=1 FL=1
MGMCGIIGYVGQKQAYDILLEGFKRLEYMGYDSAGISIIDKKSGFIMPNTSSETISLNKNNHYFRYGHTGWDIGRFKKSNYSLDPEKFEKKDDSMNILNLIEKENYYARVTEGFQGLLDNKTKIHKEICNELGISARTFHRMRKHKGHWCNLEILFNISRLLQIEDSLLINNINEIKTKNSFPITPIEIKLNDSLGRILGHILGDGGIHVKKTERKYRVFYVNNEERLLDRFKLDVENVFGGKSLYFRKRKSHGDEIWLFSSLGFVLYRLLDYDKHINKRVPLLIKNSEDKRFIGSFLQALYDDDGFLYSDKKMIVISLVNQNLLNDIRRLIIKLGIKPNKVLIHESKNRSRMYYFSITGRENIVCFKKRIGFMHPVKKDKLNRLLESYK